MSLRTFWTAAVRIALFSALLAPIAPANAQTQQLAPGFTARTPASKLLIVQPDIELYSLGIGVQEPRADWTEQAQQHFRAALLAHPSVTGSAVSEFKEKDLDDLAQVNSLHGAVANAVWLHHMLGLKLPTKEGKLGWSLGDAVQPLRAKSGADYAMFFWLRDSYSSGERVVAMIALAALGVGVGGGVQIGYASLVDLRDGRVVWFNSLQRASGDLRDPKSASETVEALLRNFPSQQAQ